MEDEAPPVGLSEDEAFEPPRWVRPLLGLCAVAFALMVVIQLALAIALLMGDEVTTKAWDFWGDPSTLGTLLLASATLMALGLGLLLRRRDDSLSLLLLGMTVFEVTMLWGLVHFEGAEGPTMVLLLMLVPLLAMFGFQSAEVRRWYFQSAGTGE
jgi:hypothetical protein